MEITATACTHNEKSTDDSRETSRESRVVTAFSQRRRRQLDCSCHTVSWELLGFHVQQSKRCSKGAAQRFCLFFFFHCYCLPHPLLTTRIVPITLKRTEGLQGECEGRGRRGGAGGSKIPLGKMHAAVAQERQFGWEASSGKKKLANEQS